MPGINMNYFSKHKVDWVCLTLQERFGLCEKAGFVWFAFWRDCCFDIMGSEVGTGSSLVMTQPLKSFKLCSLKWSFSWILTPEDLWNFSAGMDYLIRLQRLDLEGWVVSLLFPVCRLLFWRAANHFHFRVVLWFGLFLRLHQALCH